MVIYINQRQIKKVTEHSKHDKNCAFALHKRSFWTTPFGGKTGESEMKMNFI